MRHAGYSHIPPPGRTRAAVSPCERHNGPRPLAYPAGIPPDMPPADRSAARRPPRRAGQLQARRGPPPRAMFPELYNAAAPRPRGIGDMANPCQHLSAIFSEKLMTITYGPTMTYNKYTKQVGIRGRVTRFERRSRCLLWRSKVGNVPGERARGGHSQMPATRSLADTYGRLRIGESAPRCRAQQTGSRICAL